MTLAIPYLLSSFCLLWNKEICIESGKAQERMIEITNIFKTLLLNKSPNHSRPRLLNRLTDIAVAPLDNVTLAIVKPKPKQTLIAVIKIFLSDHPNSEIDFIPIVAIEPNKMTIVPPITTSGME